jgi:hypothetical protein
MKLPVRVILQMKRKHFSPRYISRITKTQNSFQRVLQHTSLFPAFFVTGVVWRLVAVRRTNRRCNQQYDHRFRSAYIILHDRIFRSVFHPYDRRVVGLHRHRLQAVVQPSTGWGRWNGHQRTVDKTSKQQEGIVSIWYRIILLVISSDTLPQDIFKALKLVHTA